MPVKAFPFDKLDASIENVYEAVIVAARRARQINDEQMIQVRTLTDGDETMDGEEVKINRDDILDLEKLPKPVATALDELLAGKVKHEYLNREEE